MRFKTKTFPSIYLITNICNIPDSDDEDKDSLNSDDPYMSYCCISEIPSSLLWNYWGERDIHINTGYSVNWWMLCVIPQNWNGVIDNYCGNHKKKFNNIIKTFFTAY